ncbi:hypothetical protein JYU14_03830 [Simkania negevensis]|uniref:1-deoxy-D-xylulose-5-phosphate synthase n=1 Tax=Simkania negevensis TaxID=83561 RepID=A0ABS3AR37_9BACT|nr:hypothetical protein [Simkania negevensis]
MTPQPLPRDVFIDEIYHQAQQDKDVYFITADLGAQSLDRFRTELPNQFIHCGISEQTMIDVACGMAQNGKKVYCYAMACFATTRCYEQIKVALAVMDIPVTIVGVGVGYSYDNAGPTHYAIEDVSFMRCLGNIEIVTPVDTQTTRETARLTYNNPRLRYVRLDRKHLPDVYEQNDRSFITQGFVETDPGNEYVIVTCGYMHQQARKVRTLLKNHGLDIGIIDAYRVKPLDLEIVKTMLAKYNHIITFEEHFLSGGLGSIVAEVCADTGLLRQIHRIAIKDSYYCDNGGRDYLHSLSGLDTETVVNKILAIHTTQPLACR